MASPPLPGRGRTLLTATALTLATLITVSCGAESRTGVDPVAPPTESERVRLLYDAEQLLLRFCMRRHGFEYTVVPSEPVPGRRDFPYVLDDRAWARRHGYGRDISRRLQRFVQRDPNRRYFTSLSPARKVKALAAANGPSPYGLSATLPTGGTVRRSDRGCVSHAQRELYGDLPAWFRASTTADALRPVRIGKVLADSRFVRLLAPWKRCMRLAGHPYASPADARAAALSPTRPLSRPAEIALATAEADCAIRSGLAGTARRLDRDHETALRRRYRAATQQWSRLRAEALPRARAVLRDR
ncbi:hypothetical protein [Streptomyces liangshanensis]|uniref:hypothetical protein n=1 Tax=Streptomyces liangshanensis TaxID=2717324 RepID=UPI0036DABCD2